MKRIHTVWVLTLTFLTNSLPAAAMGIERILLTEMGQELIVAARRDALSRVEEILALNPSLVNFKDTRGWTPLVWAAYWGYAEIMERLISTGADLNIQNEDGKTALMGAAKWGRTEIVNSLIAASAEVNTQDNYGCTALMYAARWRNEETVQVLLAARALSTIPNNKGKTALLLAQKRGHTNIMELLQNHLDIEPEEETLMVKPAVD